MTNTILKAILSSLLIWGSSVLVSHHLYAQTPLGATAPVTTFTDVTTQAGFSRCPTCQLNSTWGHGWADYDGDGFIDIITLGHVQPQTGSISQLWHNNRDGTFTDVTSQAGLDPHNGDAHGAVWDDFDNDGLVDLFICNGAPNTAGSYLLYHNNGNSNGWLKVVLRGTHSNASGIGAKLSLVASGKTQYRQYTGQHYMSQNYIPVHFGLGQAPSVASLTINWPSGTTQTLTNIAINQTITVVEP